MTNAYAIQGGTAAAFTSEIPPKNAAPLLRSNRKRGVFIY